LAKSTADASINLSQATSFLEIFKNKGSEAFEKVGESAKEYFDKFQNLASKHGQVAGLIINQIMEVKDYYKQLSNHENFSLKSYTSQVDELSNMTASLGKDSGILKGLGEALGMTTDAVLPHLKKIAEGADQILYTQQGMLQAATSAGTVGNFYARGSFDVDKMNASAVKLGDNLVNVTAATTGNHDETVKMFGAFQKIPGAMQGITEGAAGSTGAMEKFTGMIRFAAGTNQSFGVVSSQVTRSINILGTSFEGAMENAARLSRVSRDLGIPLDIANTSMDELTNTFRTWGDTTRGSEQIFSNLYQSFKDTGLGASEATRIIGDMTKSMSNLGIAKEALISGRTGGPGGLQGAFQIEQLLSEGKTDEVLKKMQQSLRQAMGGGKIIDLKEAGTSQASGQQYAKQRGILASGAFGEFGKDAASANKILEVMSKGGDLNAKELSPIKKVLEDSKKDGEAQQAQTNNLLQGILMGVLALRTGSNEEAAKLARSLSENKYGLDALAEGRGQAETRYKIAGKTGLSEPSGTKIEDDIERGLNILQQGKDTGAKIKVGFKSLLESYNEQNNVPKPNIARGEAGVSQSTTKVVQNAAAATTAAAAAAAKGQPRANQAVVPINIMLPPCPHCGKTNHGMRSSVTIPTHPADLPPGF